MLKKVAIVGGGITGLTTALFLSKKNFEVTLFEKNKLLMETSSKTTQLIHGGLRYLESFQLKEVQNGLNDRAWWFRNFPNETKEISFLIPFQRKNIDFYKHFLGVKFYDFLAGYQNLSSSKIVDFKTIEGFGLLPNFQKGIIFSDGHMKETLSQKLIEQIKANQVSLIEEHEINVLDSNGKVGNKIYDAVIISAGPWTKELLDKNNIFTKFDIDYIKGSHLVFENYLNPESSAGFMLPDINKERYIFVLPTSKGTLVGTTEVPINHPNYHSVNKFEEDYLIESINNYFVKKFKRDAIIDSYSGVRPLIKKESNDFHNASRDFVIEKQGKLFSIFGGKWTTSPSIARKIVKMLST